MNISGVDESGNVVSAPVKTMAQSLQQPGEDFRLGDTPTTIVYTNQQGKSRSVDLQEAAQASGLRNVQFHFDHDSAVKQGFLKERDVDFGTAYNLERIKTDDLKDQYLKSKGYTSVIKSGDDYYNLDKDGNIYPINNKDGLDLSDLARIVAHVGRDTGSTVGATAAVGGGAVAALPTGGSSLVGGMVAAGAAGAAGGVAGEAAQNLVDKALGDDAAKYNARLSGSEEAAAYGKDALVGGISGVAQPLMTAGIAAAKSGIIAPAKQALADSLESVAPEVSDWFSTSAAKTKTSAALARLPQGYAQRFSSPAQAAAQDALDQGQNMMKAGTLSGKGMSNVVDEASAMLKSGSAKAAPQVSEEQAAQAGLRQAYQSQTLEAAKQAASAKTAADNAAADRHDAAMQLIEKGKELCQDQLPGHKTDLETLFNPNADREGQLLARNKILTQRAAAIGKEMGGIGVDALSGAGTEPTGMSQSGLKQFYRDQTNEIYSDTKEWLSSNRQNENFLSMVPNDTVKGKTVQMIRNSAAQIDDPSLRQAAANLIKGIDNHGMDGASSLKDAINDFTYQAYNAADKSGMRQKTRGALFSIHDAMEQYESQATGTPDVIAQHYDVAKKMLGLMGQSSEGVASPSSFDNLLGGLHTLTSLTGDTTPVQKMAKVQAMDDILAGNEKNKAIETILDAQTQRHMDALRFIKDYSDINKDVIPSTAGVRKRAVAGTVGFLGAKAMGASTFDSMVAGFEAAQFGKALPDQFGMPIKMAEKAGGTALEGLGKLGAGAAKITGDFGTAPTSAVTRARSAAVNSFIIEPSEEYHANQSQKPKDYNSGKQFRGSRK